MDRVSISRVSAAVSHPVHTKLVFAGGGVSSMSIPIYELTTYGWRGIIHLDVCPPLGWELKSRQVICR